MTALKNKITKLLFLRDRYLKTRPVYSIAFSLGKLSARWLDRHFSFRKKAVRRLMERSHFTERMASELLDSLFKELTAPKLMTLLKSELGNPRVLDGFEKNAFTGLRHRALGPRLICHIFSGNVPNPSIVSFILGMLVKSINAGKLSSEDAGFLDIYLESLKKFEPRLAKTNLLLDSRDKESAYFCLEASDLAVVYGSSNTVKSLRQRVSDKTAFFGYGHRVSFGIYTREALTKKRSRALAQKAARDIWMMDQRGCLSPLSIYLEKGGSVAPQEFGELLAQALRKLSLKGSFSHPALFRTAGHELLKYRFRVSHLENRSARCWESRPRGQWLILYDENEKSLSLSSGGQAITLKAFRKIEEVLNAFSPLRNHLAAVALEAGPSRRHRIAERLSELGISRVCRAGIMQYPPVTWHHDGMPNLASWVRWTDLE